MSDKKINLIYWISTGLFAAFMLLGSIPDVIQHPAAVEMVVKHLGYPAYFLPYLGLWKLLGVAAILSQFWTVARMFWRLARMLFAVIADGLFWILDFFCRRFRYGASTERAR